MAERRARRGLQASPISLFWVLSKVVDGIPNPFNERQSRIVLRAIEESGQCCPTDFGFGRNFLNRQIQFVHRPEHSLSVLLVGRN